MVNFIENLKCNNFLHNRHMEMFMEPVIHIEPLRMKIMRLLTPLLEKIGTPKSKLEKIMYLLFSLVFTVAVLLMYRFFLG
ncbi:hypothetical protein AQUCO_00300493v1 [Aquilegia coerulea]|uniref:Uncharacterized protein n=1 Tax=Aquilegia coerulea TaxID=218851 RepID=A0A2G5EZ26_AQUCA|nr:hypothetical protein AQUCO_00300493v1 [Aquilegia coerulea]